MNTAHYDALIVGSGAGGSAAAYCLASAGRRVLLLEKGRELPRDGSTLDVDKVIRQGIFKSKEHWLDRNGRTFEPEEYFNLGGKTNSTLSEHMLLFIKLLFTIGRIDSSLTFSVADLHLAKHFLQGRVAPRQELIQQCTNISATQ